MIGPGILYGIALIGSCTAVSGMIYSPASLKLDQSAIRLYKNVLPRNDDLEYTIVKRQPTRDVQEQNADSKERRSQMGSSFIRFGRSRYDKSNNLNNDIADYASGDEFVDSGSSSSSSSSATASRIARGRSDVIIRFGRGDVKNHRRRQLSTTFDAKSLTYGNNDKLPPATDNDFQRLSILCSNVIGSSDLYPTKLVRLCDSLDLGNEENYYDTRRKSKIIEILERDATSAQGESDKHE